MPKLCKDCRAEGVATFRPAPFPGPRCATHHRAKRAVDKTRAHGRMVERTYNISADVYRRLYEEQGGRCAVYGCRATGKTKALAVDHDHACCPGPVSCGRCVRGLLCGPHNRWIGMSGDDPAVFDSLAAYLRRPRLLDRPNSDA